MGNERTIKPNEPADFTPALGNYKSLQPFRFWCQKVLPLVYDDSLSYYELLCKVVDYLNKAMEDVETLHGDVTNLHSAYEKLQGYVNNYFSTLDVQKEINSKLDQMVIDGTFFNLFSPYVANISQPKVVQNVSEMTNENFTYVLSSNGHIYQYKNGWNDTGLIFSVDISNYLGLKSPVITDLNKITSAGVYFHSDSDEIATNTPNDKVYGKTGFMVVCYYQSNTRNYQMFYAYSSNAIYARHQLGANWLPWINVSNTGDALPSNDLNQISSSGYFFHGSSDISVTNTPNDKVYGNAIFMIVCYYQSNQRNYQLFYSYNSNDVYVRHQKGEMWLPWVNFNNAPDNLPSNDLNQISKSGYFFHGASDEAVINTPNDKTYSKSGFMLVCYYQSNTRNYQIFYAYASNAVYVRHQIGTNWLPWVNSSNTGDVLPTNDLNKILISGYFFHGTSDESVTNTPNDDVYANSAFMIACYYQSNTRNYQIFYAYASNDIYVRHQISADKFTAWTNLSELSSPNKVTISRLDDLNYSISFGKYIINLRHTISTSNNANLWNISFIKYGDIIVIPSGTDILGPIKEVGQNDFMGGVHGHEKTTELYITADGVEWDYNSEINCETIQIVMVSEIYRVSDKTHVYNRHVKLTITHNKIIVENLYTCVVDDSTIERATNGGLIAIKNTILKAAEMTNFFSSTPPSSSVPNKSKNNVSGTLYWEHGSVTLENIIGKEQESYSGYLQVFTNETPMRNKIYLDIISSPKKISNGENILGKFVFTFA